MNESIITDINKESKIFLLVIGGSASGKNYIYKKNFKFPLVDVDTITKKLSCGDFEKARQLISIAISQSNKKLDASFKSGKSIGQVSTGSTSLGTENKIKKAKDFGFKTALVLIDTDVKIAMQRNIIRDKSGKQDLIPERKVEKTNKASRKTFECLSKLVDFNIIIKN